MHFRFRLSLLYCMAHVISPSIYMSDRHLYTLPLCLRLRDKNTNRDGRLYHEPRYQSLQPLLHKIIGALLRLNATVLAHTQNGA
jgi:hypothetical protein